MDRFPNEILPVNVWANALNEVINHKMKKKPSKSERLKLLK
jgi:hypothetical protein